LEDVVQRVFLDFEVQRALGDAESARHLGEIAILEVTLDIQTVRHDTLKVAQRCEGELGEGQWAFIEGCPADWGPLPIPDGPITVGIDGGYVRDEAKQRNFEVIVGKR
jgi:hypothetical protein